MYAVISKEAHIVKHVANYEQAKKVAIQLTKVYSKPFKIVAIDDIWEVIF